LITKASCSPEIRTDEPEYVRRSTQMVNLAVQL
jgi:hypothetical protein